MIVLFSGESHSISSTQAESRITLASSLLLFVVLIGINLNFRKLKKKSLQDRYPVDEITGFMIRQDFVTVFEESMVDSNQSNEPLSLLMIDVDHFRRVNDKYGQQAGDETLTMLSKAIQSELRDSDITCRWAGDQFLVALKDCTIQGACRIAGNILDTVCRQQLVLETGTIRITTSIGVAQMVTNDSTRTLIARAETGLHSAVDNGRNTSAIGYDWILLEYYTKPIF